MSTTGRQLKRVAILVQNLHNGGAERMAANLSLELCREYELYLIVFDGSDAIYPHGGSMIDLFVPPLVSASILTRVRNVLYRVRQLRYYKKRLRIDVTISHLDGANLVNILSKRRDRVISVYHSIASREAGTDPINRFFQRFVGHLSERYIVVSQPAVEDMKLHYRIPEKKLGCIYNFVDEKKLRQQMIMALPKKVSSFYRSHAEVIVHMGRLIPLKGQKRLLRVLAALRREGRNAGLVILGEGEEREAIETLAGELGLTEHLLLPGELENPFPYVKKADVFVLCSDYEGLPMVLIEAMVCGCPVVSCDMKSGAREILAPDTATDTVTEEVEEARYGILTKPFVLWEPEEEALSCLIEGTRRMLYDAAVRERYLERCEEAVGRFTPEAILPQWRALIEVDSKLST